MWDVIDFIPTTLNFWVIENIWWNLDYLIIIQKKMRSNTNNWDHNMKRWDQNTKINKQRDELWYKVMRMICSTIV